MPRNPQNYRSARPERSNRTGIRADMAMLCPWLHPIRSRAPSTCWPPTITAQLPPDGGFEVAFAGRSNAGKSTALNALCQQNALARVSKTPGRTQQLVFFGLPPHENKYLVDLPGYGYAKVPQDLQAHWQAFLEGYFGSREALRGLVVVMDVRHPLKEYDRQMLGYAVRRGLPAHVILTKADKLGRGAAGQYPAGGADGAVAVVRRQRQRAAVLRRIEAGRGRTARRGRRLAGAIARLRAITER